MSTFPDRRRTFAVGFAGLLLTLGTRADEPAWTTERVETPRLQYRTLASTAAHTTVTYHLYVPEASDTEPQRRFPVLYWLHGSDGGVGGLARLATEFDAAIHAGRVPPLFVVFPNGLANGMWCDSIDGSSPVETVFLQEVLPDVDAHFRTSTSRTSRVIEGFSMGGYGAARLGFKHPDLFGAVSMFAAGPLQPDFHEAPRAGTKRRDQVLADVYGGSYDVFRTWSPWEIATSNAAALRDGRPIRMAVGTLDETFENNRAFDRHLTDLGIAHTFTAIPGIGHDPRSLLTALGDDYWAFLRRALGATSTPPAVATNRETGLVRRTWIVDGVQREALVHLPPATGTNAVPLVFGFHGHGGTAQGAARMLGIERLWPQAAVVYMQGLNTPGRLTDPEGKRPGWQHAPDDQGDRDLKFFDAVLADLRKEIHVDERRIYSTGHSNGGGFTYLLWATRGDAFAAMAPSGAAAASRFAGLLKPKPVLHVAGRNDPLVKFAWQEQTIDLVRKLNGCGTGEPGGDGLTTYPSPSGTPVLTLLHDGGHGFPREAPAQIVKFFQGQVKPLPKP